MANEIYDSTWWGNTIDTASSIGTSTEMIQGQFNLTKIGDEKILNGDFENGGANWNGSKTVVNGQLNKPSNGLVYQATIDVIVKSYVVVVDVYTQSSGLNIYLGGSQQSLTQGLNTINMQSGGANQLVGFNNGSGSVINSISVKEARATTVEASKCLADTIHRIGLQDIQN
jgi:hypothetical protein